MNSKKTWSGTKLMFRRQEILDPAASEDRRGSADRRRRSRHRHQRPKMSEAGGVDLFGDLQLGPVSAMAGRGSLAGMMALRRRQRYRARHGPRSYPGRNPHAGPGRGSAAPIRFRLMKLFLPEIVRAGFSGVQNFPTVGLIDGDVSPGARRRNGHGLRPGSRFDPRGPASSICSPHPTFFNPDDARAMAEAGADILIPHMGLTTKGSIGADGCPVAGGVGAADSGHARRGPARES